MSKQWSFSNILSWVLGILFVTIGIMNLILVHPIPGIFYLVFSLIFYPPVNNLLKRKVGFTIPLAVKIILALIILWGTLAVGDLAELYGF